jgi:hypothetical protein
VRWLDRGSTGVERCVKDFWSEFPQAPQEREGLIVDVGSTVKKPNSRKTGMDGLEKPLWPNLRAQSIHP